MIELSINETSIALTKNQYSVKKSAVEDRYTAEDGSVKRIIRRTGVPSISIKMIGDEVTVAGLDAFVQADSLSVTYYDEQAAEAVTRTMFIDPSSYSVDLIQETELHRYYDISFVILDFGAGN